MTSVREHCPQDCCHPHVCTQPPYCQLMKNYHYDKLDAVMEIRSVGLGHLLVSQKPARPPYLQSMLLCSLKNNPYGLCKRWGFYL